VHLIDGEHFGQRLMKTKSKSQIRNPNPATLRPTRSHPHFPSPRLGSTLPRESFAYVSACVHVHLIDGEHFGQRLIKTKSKSQIRNPTRFSKTLLPQFPAKTFLFDATVQIAARIPSHQQ
jgi:hypothetical protein